jgi:thiol-disulfide isomerase/thioredoxin
MKRLLSIMLLVLIVLAGQAQTKVWNDIVMGYASIHVGKVTKVAIYGDRTEVSIHMDFPERVAGQKIPMATTPTLRADGKMYAVKSATGITLKEPHKIPADGKVDFTLVFEPIPANTWMIDVEEPNAWSFLHIRDMQNMPVGIADTYWRNDQTGDWLIGFTPQYVIYNNKVCDIVSKIEKKDEFTLTLSDGTTVKVGKMKKNQRQIAIGKEKAVACSPITGTALPDYPTKDLRTGFVDNDYKATDSVTIVGWLKDMPRQAWQKGQEFVVAVENFITDDQENFYAKMDSLGRFTFKMPLFNSSQALIDWQRSSKSTVLEPGKTYFFLNDFKTGQTLWMGDDVRVQNEMLAYSHDWNTDRLGHGHTISAMEFKARTDNSRAASMAKLEDNIKKSPNLSQRYIDYVTGYYQTCQGESMMQARFTMRNYELPQEYMDYVGRECWRKAVKPYTLYRDFNTMMRDYMDQVIRNRGRNGAENTLKVIRSLEQQGIVTMTDDEEQNLQKYTPMLKELEAKLQKPENSGKIDSLVKIFNESEVVKKMEAFMKRVGEPMKKEMATLYLREDLSALDSVGCDQNLHDIYLANRLYKMIDGMRQPLDPAFTELAEKSIRIPAALAMVKALNDKYLAIQNMDVSQLAKLNTGDDVAGMSDGEKILRKICEPYKGKLILLDIWGTWCGPCKEMLSQSQEEYKRLKDFNLVYLYLANRSSEESWKNVIKEYQVVGDNVVHYNLPQDQQAAIEHFLNVHGWPHYRLIDRNGNVLDVNADPHDLEGLARLLERMK